MGWSHVRSQGRVTSRVRESSPVVKDEGLVSESVDGVKSGVRWRQVVTKSEEQRSSLRQIGLVMGPQVRDHFLLNVKNNSISSSPEVGEEIRSIRKKVVTLVSRGRCPGVRWKPNY